MKQVTVYDIAQEADVSVSTVSRVLNGTAPVKQETKDKVLGIVEKYNFQPNALARSLLKKKTGSIGIILPDITNPFFPEVFMGIENKAIDKGYTFFLCNTGGEYSRESEFLSVLMEKQVDGILFLGGRINLVNCPDHLAQELLEVNQRVPVVLVNGRLPHDTLTRVYTDETYGAELATRHLIDQGHRDIAFIGGKTEMSTTADKVEAFRRTMQENGLDVREEWILHEDFSIASGTQLMESLLKMKHRPTAVFCVNDHTAVGAAKAAIHSGFTIPDDISIIGFDNTPMASTMIPELTTVSQESFLLGETAVDILDQRIGRQEAEPKTVITPKIIERESTKEWKENGF